jgi:hypothetical protein
MAFLFYFKYSALKEHISTEGAYKEAVESKSY